VQHLYVPGLHVLRDRDDHCSPSNQPEEPVSNVKLYLPSGINATTKVTCDTRLRRIECDLRHAQAHDALHELRGSLRLRSHVYMDKDHFQSVGPLALWSFTDLADPRWVLGTEFIQLQQQSNPKGRFQEQMTGIFNPAGWEAYFVNGVLFVKHALVTPGAEYPDFGCNFEIFTNPEFLELESLGPKVQLGPGESTVHTEIWTLFRNVASGDDDLWIRSAVAPLAVES